MRTEGDKMKVLLAESDKQAAEGLKLALEMCGCHVMYASTGDICLAIAQQYDADLLIVDLSLPGPPDMDCEGVIRQLKKMNWQINVVTMASENTRELEHRIRRHGILCYLTKPVLPSLVRELVLHLRERKRVTDSHKSHQPRVYIRRSH
jgi:DNA-binding response OmpR family regulator